MRHIGPNHLATYFFELTKQPQWDTSVNKALLLNAKTSIWVGHDGDLPSHGIPVIGSVWQKF